jgi:hypothetical protein
MISMGQCAELTSAPWKAASLVRSPTHFSEEAIIAGVAAMTKPLIEATASSTTFGTIAEASSKEGKAFVPSSIH